MSEDMDSQDYAVEADKKSLFECMEKYYSLKCPKCGKYMMVRLMPDDVVRCPICNSFMREVI